MKALLFDLDGTLVDHDTVADHPDPPRPPRSPDRRQRPVEVV
jgi:FMN phosphatase YigB (HAD superfamily)